MNKGGLNYRIQEGCHNCKYRRPDERFVEGSEELACAFRGDVPEGDFRKIWQWYAENATESCATCDSWVDGDGWLINPVEYAEGRA